jgi:hypothetical protein
MVLPVRADGERIILSFILSLEHAVEDYVANGTQHVVIGMPLEGLAVESVDRRQPLDAVVEALGGIGPKKGVLVFGDSRFTVPVHPFLAQA